MGLQGSQRVHVAPQGYETERIYVPIVENEADQAVLLTHTESTQKGDECLETVTAKLEDADISYDCRKCDLFDMYATLWAFAKTIDRYDRDDVFVNLSTGSKITAISGMIACMGTNAYPYYVKANEYTGETISKGVKDTVQLSAFPIGLPDRQYLEVLEYLDENGPVAKKDVVEFTQDQEFPLLSSYNRQDFRHLYKPVNREILDPLEERGYIDIQRRGQSKQIKITNEGKETLKIFRYMLE